MDDKKMLTINKADGTKEEVEEVVSFEFNDTKKHYLIYSKNETDQNGNVTVYVTEFVSDKMGTRLLGVSNDDEWAKIKDSLRLFAKKEDLTEANINVYRKGDFRNRDIAVLQTAKKLKTRGMDYLNIKSTPVTIQMVNEENVIEEPKVELNDLEKEEPIVPQPEIEETPIEKDEPIGEFAYSSHIPEEEIDPDAIKQIKGLGDAYKGQPKVEIKKPVVEEKEEKKITEEEFLIVLDKESYSPKTKEYKNKVKNKYNQILEEIEENKKQIDEITATYGAEKATGVKLHEKKNDSQKIIDGINGLDLNFLVDRKDNNSINSLTVLETLFNEHRQIIIDTIQEIKKSDDRKQEIGQKEQMIRTEGAELNDKKKEFIENNYPKLVSINEIDKETRENAEKLTEFTGIADDSVYESDSEEHTINPMNNLQDNPFAQVTIDASERENMIPSINI